MIRSTHPRHPIRWLSWALFIPSLFAIVACPGNDASNTLSCTSSAVPNGTDVSLTVNCSGGTAPYSIASISLGSGTPSVSGSTSGFSGSTTLALSESLATLSGVTGTYEVTDSGTGSNGTSGQQSFTQSFTVSSDTSGSAGTGCTLTASTTSPSIGEVVTFSMDVVSGWGTAPYTFSGFSGGTSTLVIENPVTNSSTESLAEVEYGAAGSQTASVTVTDASGNTGTCQAAVTVQSTTCTATSCSSSSNETGSLTCTANSTANPATAGQTFGIYPTVTGAIGAIWFSGISYPTASGFSGNFVSATELLASFSQSGTYNLVLTVRDQGGQVAYCSLSQNVD